MTKSYTIAARAVLALSAAIAFSGAAAAKDKVFLSMSYIGNDWQGEAASMQRALASHPSNKDKIDFEVQVAGPNAQKQIQQINAMVQAGAKAIVIYPISPTALNQAVKAACDKGVHIFAYDAEITEPCAHNVHIDQLLAGKVAAEWLVKAMGGKGNVVYLTGVPGTSTDTQRTKASMEVFAKYPDVKVVAQGVGMWSQAVARTEMTKILASHPWDKVPTACLFRWAATPFSRCRTRPVFRTARRSRVRAREPMVTASRCCRCLTRKSKVRTGPIGRWARRASPIHLRRCPVRTRSSRRSRPWRARSFLTTSSCRCRRSPTTP